MEALGININSSNRGGNTRVWHSILEPRGRGIRLDHTKPETGACFFGVLLGDVKGNRKDKQPFWGVMHLYGKAKSGVAPWQDYDTDGTLGLDVHSSLGEKLPPVIWSPGILINPIERDLPSWPRFETRSKYKYLQQRCRNSVGPFRDLDVGEHPKDQTGETKRSVWALVITL